MMTLAVVSVQEHGVVKCPRRDTCMDRICHCPIKSSQKQDKPASMAFLGDVSVTLIKNLYAEKGDCFIINMYNLLYQI